MAAASEPLEQLQAFNAYAVDRCGEIGESYDCPDNADGPTSERARELGRASLERVKARRRTA